jgi:ribosomal-protein-alanine N-acetyltransferase
MNRAAIFSAFPTLETPRLRLRAFRAEDAQAILHLFGDEAVTRYYDLETMTSLEQAETLLGRMMQRFERAEALRWGIALKETDALIGTGGYNSLAGTRAQIGYDLASAWWGRGLMTEALAAILRFGFEQMELNRIEAGVMPGNEASVRVLRKLGFQEEGTLREYGFWKGAFHDLRWFALLKREYVALAGPMPT